MAIMTVPYLRAVIAQNGHLVIDGKETKAELIEALLNLRKHTYTVCKAPGKGTPIEALIPDPRVLVEEATKKKFARTVMLDMTHERL